MLLRNKLFKNKTNKITFKKHKIIIILAKRSVSSNEQQNILHSGYYQRFIVGKGGHTIPFLDQQPPFFSKIPPFLEIQDAPNFHRSIRKTKVLNNSCKQFV